MLTLGFSYGISAPITLDGLIVELDSNKPFVTTYINVTDTEGVIVYENSNGVPQVTWGFLGANAIAARKILTSATMAEIEYTTSAAGMYACGSHKV